MVRRWAFTVVAIAVAVHAAGPAAAQPVTEPSLQESVQTWAAEIGAPGVAAQIVDRDGVVQQAYAGVDGDDRPVDGDTPFVWGSVSKQFAAATAAGLERDGVLDASTPVVELVPQASGMLVDPVVTVDDLVHHTSGLPHDITVTDDWTRRQSAIDAVAAMSAPDGTGPRGEFRYSSLNYLILQAVIEQETGTSYPDALRREVLEPAESAAITDPDAFVDTVPPGHLPYFGSARTTDVGVDSAGLGYGYLAGSLDELGRYASWRLGQLEDGEADGAEVPTGQGATYGSGLFHETIGGEEVWWHSGAVPGYYTYVAFVPATDTAMVLATNRYGEIEAERIAAVGRNLTTSVVDDSTTALPGSMAPVVLGVLGVIVVLLAIGIVVRVVRLLCGTPPSHTVRGAVLRAIVAIVLGAVAVYAVVFGVSAFAGAPLSVMGRWAPDVTLLVWVLLGTIVAASAVSVVGQVVGLRRHQATTDSVRAPAAG